MNLNKLRIALLTFVLVLLSTAQGFSGFNFDNPESDTGIQKLYAFFDLRDRETFIQVTNTNTLGNNIHIQIFDVSNNCDENDFFDSYTPNDTHVYNIRDIVTNDGNPSGVVLPDGAYGVFIAYGGNFINAEEESLIGNFRILDNNGYEYRTNIQGPPDTDIDGNPFGEFGTFNFNSSNGVVLSDIVTINTGRRNDTNQTTQLTNPPRWTTLDVNIYDLNEVVFSCRKIIATCINKNSPLYEGLLEEAANQGGDCSGGLCAASVADFEYGINNAIPHSKGGELLCPGNIISDGIVRLEGIGHSSGNEDEVVIYVGFNNGNGRGSMDSYFNANGD